MTAITINNDQANSLLDLVNDQIRAQRVYLRSTPLNRTHITALTHFRNLKRIILKQEAEARRQEEATEQAEAENIQLYDFFTIGVKEAERRKELVNR
jgi:hypothetical protein